MDGSNAPPRPAWGPKKSWAVPSSSSSTPPTPSTASSSREPTPSSSSAFPPLSSPQVRRPSARPTASFLSADSLISSSSFNPYPTRRQELAQRAASHGTRKRSHITRSDPATSRIHSLLDYDPDDDAVMHELGDDGDDDAGEVSSRGATMSSIVFRDLSASASTSRSSSPWQQPGLSAGLAMFATTMFGGEPLRVLANVDEELGAAHMGPRIYKRHNQKHVRNKVRAKIDAGHSVASLPDPAGKVDVESGRTLAADAPQAVTAQEQEHLRSVDLQKLVDECRRCHNLLAVQARTASDEVSASSTDDVQPMQTLLAAIRVRIADPQTWTTTSSNLVLSDDLLPVGLSPQQQQIDFSALPPSLLVQVRQAVLQGLGHLLDAIVQSTRQDLALTLSRLLSMLPLRPTITYNADLKPALQQTFLHLLDAFHHLPDDSSTAPTSLFSQVLAHMEQQTGSDALVDLVGELVALCGQQMSSDPTVLTETQDSTLVCASRFLALCFTLNATRPAATRLPAHAFYCTVLDLAPFLEHFVHHAASLVRTTPAAGMAHFNMCRWPMLLSLGAKVRILQLENELRLARAPPRDCGTQRFAVASEAEAELVVLPTSLNLRIERGKAWEQSRALLLQLLESAVAVQRGLRVEFAGELAADGGGPAREWFATVASTWTGVRSVISSHGWFTPSAEKEAEDTAAFLGLLLALAALHTTKLALPFTLPPVAFKIATAPALDELVLTPVDLEFADPALAKSLQAVLDWTASSADDADRTFDATFSLTWSTTVRTAAGAMQTLDLVPGGRHRSVRLARVRLAERREYVSRLVWRVVVGSVKQQVLAFREAWQAVMPGRTGASGAESATDLIGTGGLALSLFSAEEIGQAILALPSSSSTAATPLDVADIKASTEIILPTATVATDALDWFWTTWTHLSPRHQRRLLAFITGAEDVPASGARGIGLRIHVVATDDTDARAWPLPWSSTCTSTLFLPTYPSLQLLRDKVGIAIEHYQGFGLR
ncbi:conserved hypothetical protein [Sporisorium reilianum SRZ2]|uniref:HECT-type E3 ubiquitin transferase n=1 Tax=Sporisorium reilianum (strain SRZ2) TaxID=999809 RepID=E6ZJG5_SPORE|nr:conserved hypothetical protein [Sporisorium reilianum SRZ2]